MTNVRVRASATSERAPRRRPDHRGGEDRGHEAKDRDAPRLGDHCKVACGRTSEHGHHDFVADFVRRSARRPGDRRARVLDDGLDPLAVVELHEKPREARAVGAARLEDAGVFAVLSDDRDGLGRGEVREEPEPGDQRETDDDRRQRRAESADE